MGPSPTSAQRRIARGRSEDDAARARYGAGFSKSTRSYDQPSVSYGDYLLRPDFWEATLQNWQSEFLAVGSMTIFTVYLRQRGSPESKPVGAPHEETASSG